VVLDPHAYQYPGVSKNSPFGLNKQQEKFRQINNIVAFNHALPEPDNYVDFLKSIYPKDVTLPGSKAVRAPTPPAWQSQAFLYENVIKPSCRTCHMWQPTFNFETPIKAHLDLGVFDVCAGQMPNAMSPMLRLWKTTNPNLAQLFVDSQRFHDVSDFCGKDKRISVNGSPPTLTVVAPNGPVGYTKPGTFSFGVEHTATVSDSEDGSNCCTVRWTSDVDGSVGLFKDIRFQYPTPGPRVISVVATDKQGRMAFKSFPLEVKNFPPQVSILAPAASTPIVKNTPVTFKAFSFDVNEFGIPCARLKWTSNKGGDTAFPFTGCEKAVTFNTIGTRTITVTATDEFGLTATEARPFNVVQ